MKEVVIVSMARTPIGSFQGGLSSLSATRLGSIAIRSAVERAGIRGDQIQEVFMGNVLSAGLGQAPATQAALGAGLPDTTPCTTINKVCASGMKAIMLAAQTIQTGQIDIALAGGMESMSNVPYYLDKARNGYRMGHGQVVDGMIKDGLWDVYKDFHMGMAGELCAKEHHFTREAQDEFAIDSYKKAQAAQANHAFDAEITPVSIEQKGKDPIVIQADEDITKVNFEKMKTLRPAFDKEGTITAANASKINDGASAVVLMSAEKAAELGIKPIARIAGFGDAAGAPEWFTTAPAKAMPIALNRAGITIDQVDSFEINEAFSVVSMVNSKLLNIPAEKININGGAVAMGHPIGSSGARITMSLITTLKANGGKFGCAGICNGGGGASAIVIEVL